jgi:hypothetical protein
MKKTVCFAFLFAAFTNFVFSFDFGMLIDQKVEVEEPLAAERTAISYSPAFTPWFSWDGGDGLSLYFSGILSLTYSNEGWKKPHPLLEISHFALNYRAGQNFFIELGRIAYADSMGFTARGLFDGLRIEADLPFGSISGGLWYTGLLYKETAKILMTPADAKAYAEICDWKNFGAYFAPRRVLTAFHWDMPLGEFHTLTLEALAQFDLTGSDEILHAQYGEIQFDLFPTGTLGLTLATLFEAMETGDGNFGIALGGLARIKADVPGSLNDGITFNLKFTSGPWNDTFIGFTPLSSPAQGAIFSGTLSGLASVSAEYDVRFHRTVFLNTALRYFMRTFDENFYGGELWASFSWQPLDDLRFSLGSGIFLPGLGNIYPADTKPGWKITAGLSLSL